MFCLHFSLASSPSRGSATAGRAREIALAEIPLPWQAVKAVIIRLYTKCKIMAIMTYRITVNL